MKEKNFEPLRLFLKDKNLKITENHEININVTEKDGFYLYNYNDTVMVPRDDPVLVFCRGLVLKENGVVANFPFKRFFNYHEPEHTDVDWSSAKILEKVDGSLISVWHDGYDWRVTTRGSFYPNVSGGVDFEQVFRRLFKGFDMLVVGLTYCFELVSCDNRIVTRYNDEFVVLLGVRDLNSLLELDQVSVDILAEMLEVRRPKMYSATDINSCRAQFAKLKEDDEGFVVVDNNFNRFKLKQESYLKMARIMSLKDQDILEFIRGKTEIDADFDSMPEVKEKIEEISKILDEFTKKVKSIYKSLNRLESKKEFALDVLKYPFKGVLFNLRKGLEFNDIDFKYKQLIEWGK